MARRKTTHSQNVVGNDEDDDYNDDDDDEMNTKHTARSTHRRHTDKDDDFSSTMTTTGEEETWLCMEMEHTYGCALFAVFLFLRAPRTCCMCIEHNITNDAAPAVSPRQFQEWRVCTSYSEPFTHASIYGYIIIIIIFSFVDFSRFVSFFFVKIEAVYFCIWQWNFTFFSLFFLFFYYIDNISTSFKKHIVYLRMHVCSIWR